MSNWVDFILIVTLGLYGIRGALLGFLRSTFGLLGFALSFILGLIFYGRLGLVLEDFLTLPPGLVRSLAFLAIWVVGAAVYTLIARLILGSLADSAHPSLLSRFGGVIPSVLQGALFLIVVLIVAVVLPVPGIVRSGISESRLASAMLAVGSVLDSDLRNVVSGTLTAGLFVLTVLPRSDERVEFNFTLPNAQVDRDADERVLQLVNEERMKEGLLPLTPDVTLQAAARAHSQAMLAGGATSPT